MSISRSNYIQIPLWRCAGNKDILNDVSKILEEKHYKTESNGGILTIIKPEIGGRLPADNLVLDEFPEELKSKNTKIEKHRSIEDIILDDLV